MLPASARMRRHFDFSHAFRTGKRIGRSTMVLYVAHDMEYAGESTYPRVGLVISRAVGNAVRRHRVARQLRQLMADRLSYLPSSARIVVRALPRCANCETSTLARDLDSALARLIPGYRDRTVRS